DPRRLREARLQRLRHQSQPRELHAVWLLSARVPFDAKQSMLITYVPAAVQAGARLYANCPVRRIVAEAGRVRRVEGEVVDALGRPRHRFTVTAPVVVLCAG